MPEESDSNSPAATTPAAESNAPAEESAWVDLASFDNRPHYDPGRTWPIRCLWYIVGRLLFESGWLPLSGVKRWLLRRFGARVGVGFVIKPNVRIKYPWRLKIGDHCWIGQDVWIDNLAQVSIGANCCVSQGVYLCTGSHDWSSPTFDLKTGEIHIKDAAWVAAKAVIAPGVTVGEGVVLMLSSVATGNLKSWMIYSGTPAQPVKRRKIQ